MRKRIAFSIVIALFSAQASAVTLTCENEIGTTKEYTTSPRLVQGTLYRMTVGSQYPFTLLSPEGSPVPTAKWSIVGDANIVTRDFSGYYFNYVLRGTASTGNSYIKTAVEENRGPTESDVKVAMDSNLPSGNYTLSLAIDENRIMEGGIAHNSTRADARAARWELPDFFEIPDAAPGEVHTITFPQIYGSWGSLSSRNSSNDLFYLTDTAGNPWTSSIMGQGAASYDLLVNVRPDAEPGTRTTTITATLVCD